MAMADYYLCDSCGDKTFYDANLGYDYDDLDNFGNPKIQGVGQIICICESCSKTKSILIVDNK